MDSKICFEMISFVVEAIRERRASFRSLTATVSEIRDGQTNVGPTYFSSRPSIDILLQNISNKLRAYCLPNVQYHAPIVRTEYER